MMEEYINFHIPLIGDKAPAFHAVTTQGEINFPEDYNGKWVVLFSHPADFTPVSTTEFMTFAAMINDFHDINTELIGLSIDSVFSHIAWLRKIKELSWKDMKHIEVTFPVISDMKMEISGMYGMLHKESSETQTVRSVFIIDTQGKIRTILFYPAETGRNMNEIKRIVSALQKADIEKIATPANWSSGDDVILLPPETCSDARDRIDKVVENMYSMDWFMSFKQTNNNVEIKSVEPEAVPYPSIYQGRGRNRRF